MQNYLSEPEGKCLTGKVKSVPQLRNFGRLLRISSVFYECDKCPAFKGTFRHVNHTSVLKCCTWHRDRVS